MAEQVQQDPVDAIYAYASELMGNGASNEDVMDDLVAQGLDQEYANIVVVNLTDARTSQKLRQGQKNMGFGALWAVGGTVVTAATYNAAGDGGAYIAAWGAIVFVAIQLTQGLYQYSTAR